jgi:ATP/maltotriose-dependent transcriptional regulator MalT
VEGRFAPQMALRPPRGTDALLEREAALGSLATAFSGALGGLGSLILVDGPPGVGKSHLLGVARDIAAEDGLQVLWATARELERDYGFGVVLQLFERRIACAEPEERTRLLFGAARLAAPLLSKGPREALPKGQAFSLLHGLYWLTAHLSEEQPLAIFLDDAQWADEPSLRFVLYMAQRVEELPVVMVVAAQPPEAGPRLPLLEEIAVHPATSTLHLGPLTPEAVARRVRGAAFPTASDEFCQACFETTRGNPLLLRELTVELGVRGVDPTPEAAQQVRELAPKSVSGLVLQRLRRIGPAALELARAVAVLGDDVEPRRAADLAGLEHRPAARVADELMGADILQRADRLSFVHPVVKAAVYAEQSPGERAHAHLQAARMLGEEGAPAEQVAAQLLKARRSGSEWAVDTLSAAAALAMGRGAPESAVRYLRRALKEPPRPDRRAMVVLDLGRAEAVAGEPEAVGRLQEAIDLIEDRDERAATALDTGRTLYAQGRHADAAAAFKRGMAEVREEDRLLAQLQAAYAAAARSGVPHRERDLEAISAESIDKQAPDTTAARLLLANLAFERAMRGDAHDSVVEVARRALDGGALLDDETADGPVFYLAVHALTIAEDLQTAEFALTAAVEDARDRGSVLGFATACHFRSLAILRRGRLNDAAADAQSAVAAQRYGWRLAVPAAHAALIETLIERDERDRATREVAAGAAALEHADDAARNAYLASRAHLRLLRGDARGALEDYLAAGAGQEQLGAPNPAVLPWRSGAARAAMQLANPQHALCLIDEEIELARAFGAPGAIGRALHVRGTLLADGSGLDALEEAVEVLERSNAALDRARALVDLGGALRRAGKRRQARDPLRRGLDLAQRCGAVALVKRAQQEAMAAGARPRRTALKGIEALTARERQVATLAAKGMSNRAIAEALFVTVKTVEWHLRHTYEKLEIRSREELREALTSADAQASGAA